MEIVGFALVVYQDMGNAHRLQTVVEQDLAGLEQPFDLIHRASLHEQEHDSGSASEDAQAWPLEPRSSITVRVPRANENVGAATPEAYVA